MSAYNLNRKVKGTSKGRDSFDLAPGHHEWFYRKRQETIDINGDPCTPTLWLSWTLKVELAFNFGLSLLVMFSQFCRVIRLAGLGLK